MLLLALSLIALAAQAMTAALAAGRRNMDWVGVCTLGFVAALGGSSLRDVLLGHYPLSWVREPYLLGLTAGAALATTFLSHVVKRLAELFLWIDAVGLVLFTISGCESALLGGATPTISIVAGLITGCFGGVLRDVLCNEIPLIFRSELDAAVSILTGTIYVVGNRLYPASTAVTLAAATVGLACRMLSIRYRWQVPTFRYSDDTTGGAGPRPD